MLSVTKEKISYNNLKHKFNTRLLNAPQARGIVKKPRIITPRKPNSARRSAVKIGLFNYYYVTSYIPGIGHNLRKHSLVLINGGGCRDLPGVNYKCIRGVFDFYRVLNRFNRRSIYGIPRPDELKFKIRRKYRQI